MSDIRKWLEDLGLCQYADAFEENRIDEGIVEEFYDVVALPQVMRPMALGFKTDEIRRFLTMGEQVAEGNAAEP